MSLRHALSQNENLPITLPHVDGPVCVACSGGLDSTVLLHRLAALPALRRRGLRALHVHHGLHADADAWADHCTSVCAALDIGLAVARVQVAQGAGSGPEAAARDARHAAFDHYCAPGEILALAHHRDDQAETFLLRALRGSGVDGLAAMRHWRARGSGWLWRPLLACPRAALLAYARQHALRWIDDPSNTDAALDRNYLRHHVLPALYNRWPQASASFARSASLSAQASALLVEGDGIALRQVRTDDRAVLRVASLAALDQGRRARVLRTWIADLGLPALPAAGVAQIEAHLLVARPDAQGAFVWHGAIIRRWRDLLHAGHAMTLPAYDYCANWDGSQPLALPTGDRLSLVPVDTQDVDRGPRARDARQPSVQGMPHRAIDDRDGRTFDEPITVRFRRGGERIVLPGRAHSHTLKAVLLQAGVAPWRRERLPLLIDGHGRVLAAGDALVSATLADWLHRHQLCLRLHDDKSA